MYFHKEMIKLQKKLENMGFTVYRPQSFQEMGIINYKTATPEETKELKIKYNLIKMHYEKIMASDAILVANYDKKGVEGYIGGNTFLELGFAYVNDRDIFMIKPIPDLPYKAEIGGMEPIVINNKLTKIKDHYKLNTQAG